jgi:CubicO group peptidase (beta-lactamase class C family)
MGCDVDKLHEVAGVAVEHDSHCVVVTRDGQIVAEWYWGDTEADTQIEAFSVTKSYTSSLVGLAASETDLDLDDPASDYIDAWAGTDSEDVTVRNLLSNDSGRSWMEVLGFEDSYRALTAAEDRSQFAIERDQDSPPGTVWEYNDAAIQVLGPILADRSLPASHATPSCMSAADRATRRLTSSGRPTTLAPHGDAVHGSDTGH